MFVHVPVVHASAEPTVVVPVTAGATVFTGAGSASLIAINATEMTSEFGVQVCDHVVEAVEDRTCSALSYPHTDAVDVWFTLFVHAPDCDVHEAPDACGVAADKPISIVCAVVVVNDPVATGDVPPWPVT